MAQTAMVDGDKIKWDAYNYVEFSRKGNKVTLKCVCVNWDRQRVWMSTGFDELSEEHQQLVIAAAVAIKTESIYLNSELVIITYGVPTMAVFSTPPEHPRPACSWDRARPYALSGFRNTSTPETVRITADGSSSVAMAVAGLIVVGLAIFTSLNK